MPEILEQRLRGQEAAEYKNVDGMIKKQIDWAQRNASDLSHLGSDGDQNLKMLFAQKAEALRGEMMKLKEDLDDQVILSLNQKVLTGLSSRISLVLNISSGPTNTVTTPVQLKEIADRGTSIIAGTDVQGLVYDELVKYEQTHKPGIAARYLESLGRAVKPDTLQLIGKLHDNKDLTEADWAVAVHYVSVLADDNANPTDLHLGLALLASFRQIDRLRLLDHLPDDEKLPQIIREFVDRTYLLADQAAAFIEKKKAQFTTPADAQKLAVWTSLEQHLNSTESRTEQEGVELQRKESLTRFKHGVYGHRNSARNLFTFKGIGSTLLALNGAMTIAMNVAMDAAHPDQLFKNRAIALGIAEVGVGLEGSDGFGGLISRPRELLARILGDKDTAYTEESALRNEAFNRQFGRYYKEAKFFYSMADKIHEVYTKKTKNSTDLRPKITLEDLGLTWEGLPEEYHTESRAQFEDRISHWAADFPLTFKMNNPTNQMETMQRMRTEVRGLPPYEKDTTLRKLAKLSY